MGLISTIIQRIKGAAGHGPINNVQSLEDFLDRHAAFLSQSCVVEFCRVRSGIYWQKLFEEKEFQDRLYHSCWKSYTPALIMLIEMAEASLREPAGLGQRSLPSALEKVGLSVMARHPLPSGAPEDFWLGEQQLLHTRISALREQPVRPVRDMASPMAKVIYDNLPLHQHIVRHDYDYILNNLRMNLLRAHELFISDLDGKALSGELI
ncbi:MAG: hypothetical protein ACRCU5_05535 [Rhizobiaceae bacterium]